MSDSKGVETTQNELLFREEVYALVGACFTVYKEKGCGFLEAVYQECMEIEMGTQGIPYIPQPELQLTYKGHHLRQTYIPDFLCYDKIIVEIKATADLAPEH